MLHREISLYTLNHARWSGVNFLDVVIHAMEKCISTLFFTPSDINSSHFTFPCHCFIDFATVCVLLQLLHLLFFFCIARPYTHAQQTAWQRGRGGHFKFTRLRFACCSSSNGNHSYISRCDWRCNFISVIWNCNYDGLCTCARCFAPCIFTLFSFPIRFWFAFHVFSLYLLTRLSVVCRVTFINSCVVGCESRAHTNKHARTHIAHTVALLHLRHEICDLICI